MKLVDEYHIVATGVEQGIKQIFQRLQMYTVVLKCEYVEIAQGFNLGV